MDPTGKLGAAMKVHWVRGGGADRGARTQSRRGLILKPHGDVDAEFVLELFFGFLHFLVHEAEEWSRCREDLLDKPLSDDGDAYLDGAASTTTASSSVPKAAAGLHTSPQCPALRWYMVPGPTWVRQPQRAVEHKGKAGNKGRNQPRAMGSAPDDLPFAFLFESGPTVDNVSDPTEAFFADILPTQTTMSLGDTLRHVNVAAVEGPGVIRQIYMRDERRRESLRTNTKNIAIIFTDRDHALSTVDGLGICAIAPACCSHLHDAHVVFLINFHRWRGKVRTPGRSDHRGLGESGVHPGPVRATLANGRGIFILPGEGPLLVWSSHAY